MQQQFIGCNKDQSCEKSVRDTYIELQQKAGEEIVNIYKSGQLSKSDFELFATWYRDAMADGLEDGKRDNK